MSRIGNAPIEITAGTEVKIDGSTVTVKGKLGELSQVLLGDITAELNEGNVIVKRPSDQKKHKAFHGLYRSLVANMIEGVSVGFKKELELVGVGFKVSNQGQLLDMHLGYSHPIHFLLPDEIKLTTAMEKGKAPSIVLESVDKQLLGQVCAKIRSTRKIEPYKGKGVRFKGEEIRRKEGKTASK
ncbi:MAG: 50S ribosomal protein L6 [Chitinophagales bacterium]